MYRNLEAEMLKSGIDRGTIAKLLGISYGTVCAKLSERSEFSLSEAFTVRDYISPGMPVDQLFKSTATDEPKSA